MTASTPESLANGRFELVRPLGAGATGVVYEAFDRQRGAAVALKMLRAMTPEGVLRLKNEFRALQGVSHPNLATLVELFCDQGRWFFTMELVAGASFLGYVWGAGAGAARSDELTRSTLSDMTAPEAGQARARVSPPSPSPHLAKLRGALAQLARALMALHGAGKVHRDVKPSNILVTDAGRLVLLDFGAIAEVSSGIPARGKAADNPGTRAYAAPEQIQGAAVGPAADWYSVGVLLFHALTGCPPYALAASFAAAGGSSGQEPALPSPCDLAPGAPPDLGALCLRLLDPDPGRRADGLTILRLLAAAEGAAVPGERPRTALVGRDGDLERLRELLARSQRDGLMTVEIRGPSGIGKTVLLRAFAEKVEPGVVLLAGRCYERETVPYKGVDGLVDRLAAYLADLPHAALAAVMPRNVTALAQIFPVLRRVPVIAEAPRPLIEEQDLQELRGRAFSAFRELFARMADLHPVVMAIDDWQWADDDSRALLAELVRSPAAPRILLLLTVRTATGAGKGGPAGPAAAAARPPATAASSSFGEEAHTVTLGALGPAAATALAADLLGQETAPASAPDRVGVTPALIAQEAGGHPLLITEIARCASRARRTSASPLRFEDAVWERICELDGVDRRLLEILSVAGVPVGSRTLLRAAGVAGADLPAHLARLAAMNLLRTGPGGVDRRPDEPAPPTIELCHDRIGAAVLERLDPESRRQRHHALAVALEEEVGGHNLDGVAFHWMQASQPERAARYALLAARAAVQALAFDRAVHLFHAVLKQAPPPALRASVTAELAAALANAGRGAEAAAAYVEAAAAGDPERALDLRRRGAEQLLRGGHIDAGLALMQDVLAQVGLGLPRSPRGALVRLLGRRAQLRLRGLRFNRHRGAALAPDQVARIDTCWSIASGLAVVDTVLGAYFQTRHLQLALAAGDPARVARALAAEAAYSAVDGARAARRTSALLASAAALAEEVRDPQVDATVALCSGARAYLECRFTDCLHDCGRAEAIWADICGGEGWERDTAQIFTAFSQYYLGQFEALAREVPDKLRAAIDRGDIYLATSLRAGVPNAVHLRRDLPAEARSTLTADFGPRQRRYHFQSYMLTLAECQTDLYSGDGERAHARIEERWRPLGRALLFRIQFVRVEALGLRARCALAAAAAPAALDAGRRRELTRQAAGHAARLAAERTPFSTAMADLIRGGLADLAGQPELTLRAFGRAEQGFARAGMAMYAAAAAFRQGQIGGGAMATDAAARAAAWLSREGVENGARLFAMLAPPAPHG